MKYVVIGGGIAGVSCSYELLRCIQGNDQVLLISASDHVKTVSNWTKLGQFAEFFTVTTSNVFPDDERFVFIKANVTGWDCIKKEIVTTLETFSYDRLCIATGAIPKCSFTHSKILVLRDFHSALQLESTLKDVKKIAIVGNGGIATELVYELKNVNITWVLRDVYPSSVFFLPQVSKFLESRILCGRTEGSKSSGVQKRPRYFTSQVPTSNIIGCSLAPDWSSSLLLEGTAESHSVDVHCATEVVDVGRSENLILKLSDGSEITADAAIWAIGVQPASNIWTATCPDLRLAEDNGILVDDQMMTSVPDVYACGDVCTVNWKNIPPTWKQMRLWTQARQMGLYCAKAMLSTTPVELDFCFELFAHVTYFCGYKVILLGDYKAERQTDNWYTRERIITDEQYVCCVMVNSRVVGATLIGETQLEETIENLILNRTDLSLIEEHFLDAGIDIEDYFD